MEMIQLLSDEKKLSAHKLYETTKKKMNTLRIMVDSNYILF